MNEIIKSIILFKSRDREAWMFYKTKLKSMCNKTTNLFVEWGSYLASLLTKEIHE